MTRANPYAYAVDAGRYRGADDSWLDELDQLVVFADEPRQRMGTRAIEEAGWLSSDVHRGPELALRRRLYDEAPGEVFDALADTDDPCAEAAALVHAWLATNRPAFLADWDAKLPHPLVRAGLAVQEDLCVMQRGSEGWRLTAGMLCFPTYWRLADKIGRTLDQVHGPVPHYEDDLADKVALFFDRLPAGRTVSRRNWGLTAHPMLFVPDLDALIQPARFDSQQLWLRSERQTLRRLPDTGAILFTIRVQLAPATALLERLPLAARLLDAVEHWTPEMIASRGNRHGWMEQVTGWLRRIASV